MLTHSADVRWLLIFDNVEKSTNLQPIWPITGCGSIIVTCRSEFRVESFIDEVIEVPTFTTKEGGDFILKRLGQRVTSDADLKYSQMLSDRLGGLALALEITGKQIKHRKTTVEQFIPFYNRNRQLMNKEPMRAPKNPYYDKDLDSVWETAFNSLSPEASRFLMLLCFLAPTDVPEDIFTEGKDISKAYAFLANEVS